MKLPTLTRVAAVLLLFAWGDSVPASEPSWPDPTDPLAGMGACIHFTDAKPGELEMLAQAGFRWVRMDFVWGNTGKQSGVYEGATTEINFDGGPQYLKPMDAGLD